MWVLEDKYMEIPLINNWPTLYKLGIVKVYSLGQQNYKVINNTFNKLH